MLQTQPNLKKTLIVGGMVLMVCLTIFGSIWLISGRPVYVQYNTGVDGKPVNNISVTATGKVTVKPDLVLFTATYEEKNPDLSVLQADLTKHNDAIIKALKDKGVADKDIQTASFDLQPNYYYDQGTWRLQQDGHSGSVSINVKVREIDKAGEIIDSTIKAGASQVGSLQFTIDDIAKARSDARKLAAAAAYDKAKELAESSNVGIGGLISISEATTNSSPMPMYANALLDKASDTAGSTQLSSGSLEVTVDVNATYGIR